VEHPVKNNGMNPNAPLRSEQCRTATRDLKQDKQIFQDLISLTLAIYTSLVIEPKRELGWNIQLTLRMNQTSHALFRTSTFGA